MTRKLKPKAGLFECSFCGLDRKQVKKLIAGPRVFICDQCVVLCAQIVSEELDEKVDAVAVAAERDELRRALQDIARTVARVIPRQIRCMWCDLEINTETAAKEHVGACDKHPAVIRLAELTEQAAEDEVRS